MRIVIFNKCETRSERCIINIFEKYDGNLILCTQQDIFIRIFEAVSELQYYLHDVPHRLNCDQALYRFERLIRNIDKDIKTYSPNFLKISLDYIEKITQVKWEGYWHNHKQRFNTMQYLFYYQIPNAIQNISYYKFKSQYEKVNYYKRNVMRYSNLGNEFFEFSTEYIQELFKDNNRLNDENIYYISSNITMTNINRYIKYLVGVDVLFVEQIEETIKITDIRCNADERLVNVETIKAKDLFYSKSNNLNEIIRF